MAFLSSTGKKALATKLRRLSKRAHVEVMDALFDEILSQIAELKNVSCTLADDSSLCLQSQHKVVAQVKLPRAKSVLRVMCARLSVRCSEWAQKEVSPYGDQVEFELPTIKLPCKVSFENTPDAQRFEIMDNLVPRALPAPRAKAIRRKTATI